jgi:uncharacterized membrane protein
MNKQQFLETLRKQLKGLPEADLNEIIYDYEEHFRNGIEDGKSEEEIITHLGDIRQIANQYRMSSAIRTAEEKTTPVNVGRAVIMTVTLGFFNIIIILTSVHGNKSIYVNIQYCMMGLCSSKL